jgi:formamidopyrimidine-DNA glycosylase
MPELPEVETIKRGLERLLPGKKVLNVECIDSPKSFPNPPSEVEHFLYGATITSVRRRAKVLLIELSSDYTLVIHLKMTGQLVYVGAERFGAGHPNDSLLGVLPDRSTRVVLTFSDGSHLYFNDQRKFGWIRLMPTIAVPEIDFMKRVGPEPLEESFTAAEFLPRIRRRNNTTVKAAILDQTVLAGVGNIYADESLWAAKIHPATRVRDVADKKLAQLLTEIKKVMTLSIDKGGSTDKNYVDAEGKRGSYLSFANVFRREGQPCPRCGTSIEKLRVAGRGTHVCPSCQYEER